MNRTLKGCAIAIVIAMAAFSAFAADDKATQVKPAVTLHVILQSHLDPVWLWNREQGVDAAIATARTMMPSRLIETKAGTFFATKRFDRTNTGERLHFASAAGLLHADCRTPGDEYSLLFKLTDALLHDHSAKEELFRRVTLNVLEHNRDDHLKNFGFLMDAGGHWSLAPFYDFFYSDGPNGWQTLSVSGVGENPTQADLDRLAKEVGL